MVCTFFGHKDAPDNIKNTLFCVIKNLIEKENVTEFYVGNQGAFDYYVRGILNKLSNIYEINYYVVLAYFPKADGLIENIENTMLPEGIENVPKKFSIDWRNRWMIRKSSYVVTYVKRNIGGAAKFKELAEKQNKIVININ